MDVIQKIHNLYPEMTRKQKSIADILLESPEDIAYITLANLSQKTSSSELTLLRFCQKLGYSNFLEMKAAFREYTQSMVKLLSSPQYFVPDATITMWRENPNFSVKSAGKKRKPASAFSLPWICFLLSLLPKRSAAQNASLSALMIFHMSWQNSCMPA